MVTHSFSCARLIEAGGGSLPADAPDAFPDDDGSTHEASIDKLAAAGIVQGGAGGTYGATGRTHNGDHRAVTLDGAL